MKILWLNHTKKQYYKFNTDNLCDDQINNAFRKLFGDGLWSGLDKCDLTHIYQDSKVHPLLVEYTCVN